VRDCWIIDGYNVILRLGSPGRLDPGELARRRHVLEDKVARFGRHRHIRPLVVYDGQRLPGGPGGGVRSDSLEVTFVEPPSEADDMIHHRAAGWRREGREVRVVTSDGGLALRVRAEGAVVISAEAFGQRLMERGRQQGGEPHAGEGMADIEAHFLTLHHQEEEQRSALEVAAPAEVNRSRPGLAAAAQDAGAATEERRRKGRMRQQRRLQNQRRAGRAGRRRRH